MGLGRNKGRFLSFVGTRLSASRAPSGPHTNPLAPRCKLISIFYSTVLKLFRSKAIWSCSPLKYWLVPWPLDVRVCALYKTYCIMWNCNCLRCDRIIWGLQSVGHLLIQWQYLSWNSLFLLWNVFCYTFPTPHCTSVLDPNWLTFLPYIISEFG